MVQQYNKKLSIEFASWYFLLFVFLSGELLKNNNKYVNTFLASREHIVSVFTVCIAIHFSQ
jgi:hypothetical protein